MSKLIIAIIAISLIAVIGIKAPAYALSGASTSQACKGLKQVGGQDCDTGGSQVGNVLKTVVSVISYFAGVVAVIMIILSGINFMTSNGDPQKITKARNGLIYAAIGIAVAAAAQVIVNFAIRVGNST